MEARYDTIGLGYAGTRREDPEIATEPSDTMASQRPRARDTCLRWQPSVTRSFRRCGDDRAQSPSLGRRAGARRPRASSRERGLEKITAWLGGTVEITPVLISRDTPDWHLGSFWAHPGRVLDPSARAATSGFARAKPEVVDRVVAAVASDSKDGTWQARYGHLHGLHEYDGGLRLLVAE